MTIYPATKAQFANIRRHAVNDTTRGLASTGFLLTHEQADDLGEETLAWIKTRLDMHVVEVGCWVACTPAVQIHRAEIPTDAQIAAIEVAS